MYILVNINIFTQAAVPEKAFKICRNRLSAVSRPAPQQRGWNAINIVSWLIAVNIELNSWRITKQDITLYLHQWQPGSNRRRPPTRQARRLPHKVVGRLNERGRDPGYVLWTSQWQDIPPLHRFFLVAFLWCGRLGRTSSSVGSCRRDACTTKHRGISRGLRGRRRLRRGRGHG